MQMKMTGYSRSSSAPEIHSQVHSVRLVLLLIGLFHSLRRCHHFLQGVRRAQPNLRHMRIGHDHYMSGGIRKPVEYDERVFPAFYDERQLVLVSRQRIAENALWLLSLRNLFHVLIAPRRPKIVY